MSTKEKHLVTPYPYSLATILPARAKAHTHTIMSMNHTMESINVVRLQCMTAYQMPEDIGHTPVEV